MDTYPRIYVPVDLRYGGGLLLMEPTLLPVAGGTLRAAGQASWPNQYFVCVRLFLDLICCVGSEA